MKKIVLLTFVSIVFSSCSKKVSATDIPKLNGYWEIEKVVFPDGTKKEYTINETFDYFEIKGNKGIRNKVAPQLNGTFLVTGDYEKVEVKQIEGKYIIQYTTFSSQWKETLETLTDQQLVLVNEAKNEYHYKRAAPINLLEDGKKN